MQLRLLWQTYRSSTLHAGTNEGRAGLLTVTVRVLDLKAYINRLASAQPTPGGGSAATLVGAFGAALVAMVARITLASTKHAAVHAEALVLVETADALRSEFLAARPEDEAAFAAVVAAQALPRASAADKAVRTQQLQAALAGAAELPLRVAALAAQLLDACERAAQMGNASLVSDVECALAFGRAARDASAANVRVNHRFINDTQLVYLQAQRLAAILHTADASDTRAKAIVARQ